MRIEQCMARFCKNKDWRPIIGIMGCPELVVREGVVKKGGIGMHGVFLLETHVHIIAFLKHNLPLSQKSKSSLLSNSVVLRKTVQDFVQVVFPIGPRLTSALALVYMRL